MNRCACVAILVVAGCANGRSRATEGRSRAQSLAVADVSIGHVATIVASRVFRGILCQASGAVLHVGGNAKGGFWAFVRGANATPGTIAGVTLGGVDSVTAKGSEIRDRGDAIEPVRYVAWNTG